MADDAGGLAAQVIALGRRGMARAEIAAALDLGEAELAALEAADPGLAVALGRAEAAARGWWEALPREALEAGTRFNLAAWLGAMRWRFGEGEASGEAAAPAPPPRPMGILVIPDNGRRRRPGRANEDPQTRHRRDLEEARDEVEELESSLEDARCRLSEIEEQGPDDDDDDD
jgi:hypothetical protein